MSEMCYCRTCFSSQNLIPMFGNEKSSEERSSDLFLVTGVMIKQEDDFSQYICELCNKIINDALKLRTQCQLTDKTLRERGKQKLLNKKEIKCSEICLDTNSKKIIERNEKKSDKETSLIDNVQNKITIKSIVPIIKKKNSIERDTTKKIKIKKNKTAKKKIKKCFNNKKSKEKLKIISNEDNRSNNTVNIESMKHEQSDNEMEYEDSILNEIDLDSQKLNLNKSEKKMDEEAAEVDRKKIKHRRKRLTKEEVRKYMSLAVQPMPAAGPVRCSLCRASLRQRRYFISHAKTHFEAEHGCETCGKSFTNRSSLRYHCQRVHGATRRLACDQCSFTAVHKDTMQNHLRGAHTGERPYQCAECGDAFSSRGTLVQHMRTHFGAYDVQCERCPARFRSRSELASHRNRVHLMTYTYFCYLCPGTYKAVGTVKNHIVKVHGIPRDQHPRIRYTKKKRASSEDPS